jgi:phosphoribosylglycinamide formyltransferase-1
MRTAVILSAGGAALFDALDYWKIDLNTIFVMSDRKCIGIERAKQLQIQTHVIAGKNRDDMSADFANAALGKECNQVLLFFSRFVSDDLFQRIPTFNFHPSDLPNFPGMKAIEAAQAASWPIQGVTLHEVDAGADTGPIRASVIAEVPVHVSLRFRASLAHVGKTILTGWALSRESPLLKEKPAQIDPQSLSVSAYGLLTHTESLLNDSDCEYFAQRYKDVYAQHE